MGLVEAFDEGAGEVSAFRNGERKSFFQKFGGFLSHALIITRSVLMNGVVERQDPGSETEPRASGLREEKPYERFLSAQADTFAGSERERKSVGLLRSK